MIDTAIIKRVNAYSYCFPDIYPMTEWPSIFFYMFALKADIYLAFLMLTRFHSDWVGRSGLLNFSADELWEISIVFVFFMMFITEKSQNCKGLPFENPKTIVRESQCFF